MSQYQVRVTRDSVCAGDDVSAPHFYSFSLSDSAQLSDLFAHLSKKRYLPGVSGKNHRWEALVGSKVVAAFQGNDNVPVPSKTLATPLSRYQRDGFVELDFRYKSAKT